MEKKPSAEHTREIEPTETMKWPEKNEKMPVKKKRYGMNRMKKHNRNKHNFL